MRIVVDTTDFISALIGKKHREKLKSVLDKPEIELFADNNLLTELSEVAHRDKFRKYVSLSEIALFLEVIQARLTMITPTTVVADSPDPDDNFLLSLAIDSQAEYLITGNKNDLLALSPYRGIQIIRLQAFLEILSIS
jgi:putative PIN family toxin of toxin-antitoxin system